MARVPRRAGSVFEAVCRGLTRHLPAACLAGSHRSSTPTSTAHETLQLRAGCAITLAASARGRLRAGAPRERRAQLEAWWAASPSARAGPWSRVTNGILLNNGAVEIQDTSAGSAGLRFYKGVRRPGAGRTAFHSCFTAEFRRCSTSPPHSPRCARAAFVSDKSAASRA